MKRKVYLFTLFLFCSVLSWAQTRQITGHVVADKTTENLSGVSVSVKGTNNTVSTNAQGTYTISVPGENAVLVFSYVGYTPQQVTVGNRSTVDVVLKEAITTMNDVVVIGYQTVRRRDLTGSVSSVNAQQLKDIPVTSAEQAIAGRLAGVQVTTSEGAPGAEVKIRVRGGGSITQDNSPIYIVDGMQIENALQTLSPQDIESIDVLKDASTTAIYGARGANGVVLITTKSGKAGKTRVSYNGAFGVRQIMKKIDVMSPYDFVLAQYERSRLTGDSANFADTYGTTWDTLSNYKNITPIDWQDEVFGRNAVYQNHNVSIGGGNQNTTYNLSLTSNKEEGILLESGFNRKLATFKLDHKANDKFRMGVNIRYLDQIIKGAGTTESGSRSTNRLRNAIQYRPFELPNKPEIDDFDELYYSQSNLSNPVILTQAEYRRRYSTAVNLSGYLSYQLVKDLTFKSTLGYNTNDRRNTAFNSEITGIARQYASLPVAAIYTDNAKTINVSNTLQYTKNNYKDVHDFGLLLGQEVYETRFRSNSIETRYFPLGITPEKALANMNLGTPPDISSQEPYPVTREDAPYRLFSLFGRANYSYNDRYLFNFTLRADRSSKFSYERGILYFPSASFAWRFNKESFMEKADWLSDGKLRLGYGTAGNDRIGNLLYRSLYSVNGEYALAGSIQPAFAPVALANPNLKWEKTISRNIGLDLALLNNRLQFTADAYYNKTKDLLLEQPIPPTTGYGEQIANVASTTNKGIEFQLNGQVVQAKDFSWSSNFNISFNKNKVESLGAINQKTYNTELLGRDGADEYLLKVGQPVGLMYGFVTDGFYSVDDFNYVNGQYVLKAGQPNTQQIFGAPQPGTIKLKNLGGDSLIRVEDDRAIIGYAQPKFIGGWNNQFTWKNFDASIFVNWVVGNDIFNANKIEWTDASFANTNMLTIMNNRWKNIDENGNLVTDPEALKKLNTNAQIWSPTRANRYYIHSWAIEDGSFLRINNITIGYSLPASLLKRIRISQFRVYGTVNNVATITNYSGYDPEIDTRRGNPLTPGVDMAGYPRARAFVFGVNVSF